MPVYFVCLLKASACLSVIYLLYSLLLRNITYYSYNRHFLLFFSILSCIVPFINVGVFIKDNGFADIALFEKLPSLYPAVNEIYTPGFAGVSITSLLTAVFISGVFIMLIRLVIQLLSLWKMHLKATLLQDGKVRIYHIAEPIIPFSYFNNIYINKDHYSEDEMARIVSHELAHVQQRHAIDILIIEVICIFNWFNPMAWLLKKAIRENLEFIADDAVIKKGTDKKSYQYLLLKVTGNVSFSIANNLNVSSLRKRIGMINKNKTSAFHLLKFVLFVPVTVILLLAFRNKQAIFAKHTAPEPITKSYILRSLTYAIPDKIMEAAVIKEQDKSLFKAGMPIKLDLDLFLHERNRLTAVLQKSGYALKKTSTGKEENYGIVFMIDTTLGNNSLSVQVNIRRTREQLTSTNAGYDNGAINAHANHIDPVTNTPVADIGRYNLQPSDRNDNGVTENTDTNSQLVGIK